MTEKVLQWLEGFTQNQAGPGAGWAVFPQGGQVLRRSRDILGNEILRRQLSFQVVCLAVEDAASPLEAFARWAETSPPRLGADQTVWVEHARLVTKDKEDLARYTCKLVFEFTTEEEGRYA